MWTGYTCPYPQFFPSGGPSLLSLSLLLKREASYIGMLLASANLQLLVPSVAQVGQFCCVCISLKTSTQASLESNRRLWLSGLIVAVVYG